MRKIARNGRSLRWQLSVLSVGLLVPTLLFVGVLLWRFAVSERHRSEEAAVGLSHGLAVALDREVMGVLTTLQALATSPSLQTGDLPAFYAQLAEIRRLQGIHISLRDTHGHTVLATRAPLGTTIPIPRGLAETDQEVLRGGAPRVTNIFTSATAETPVFQIIAAPVLVAGQPTYLLGASLDPDYLAEVFRRENLPRGWIATLADRNGILVARTEDQAQHAGKPGSPEIHAHAIGDGGSFYARNVLGTESLVGYARSKLTGWVAAVTIRTDFVARPLRHALVLLLALGAVLALLATAVAVVVGRRIVGAILRLRDAAEAIGQGRAMAEVATPVAEVDQVGRALRLAARQIAEREARLHLVVEGAKDHAIVTTDPAGTITSWSAGAAAIFGWSADEAVGRSNAMLFTPEDLAAGADGRERRLAARAGVAPHQRWHVRRDGRQVFMNGSIYPLPPDADGRAQGFLKVARDETERRRTDLALRELTDTLEAQVAQRTHELEGANQKLRTEAEERAKAEDALRQAQKMEAVGQLTGGIAHDFNNLLTGIIGSLDLMQTRVRQGRTQELGRYAAAATASAHRAAALTHRLLAFARRQPLDPRPTDTNALISGMEELLRRTLTERVHLEVVAAGGLWPTLCDPHQLENAVLNLAINARDAMAQPAPGGGAGEAGARADGGRLTIETANAHLDHAYARQHSDVKAGQYVCVSVTDTGTGMPPEVAARAFDPFFTTKPLGQGTGLGLSMIYGFAKQSGGHARIYSEPGQGTTVKLYLPRCFTEATLAELEAKPAPAPHAASGETVLVVEDEPVVRGLVVEVLEGLGYRALEAADGAAGLAVLRGNERLDLVITDVGLPGLNGRQMVDQARDVRPRLKVLFITGYAENAMFGNGQLHPGMEMMTKPFSVEVLAERIRAILDSGSAAGDDRPLHPVDALQA